MSPDSQSPAEGHVVAKFNLDNTKIIICDDYCAAKTKADAAKACQNMARIVRQGYRQQQLQELAKENN